MRSLKAMSSHFKHELSSSKSGATLIELLISLAILGVITAVFVNGLIDTINVRSKSDYVKIASALATGEVERLKALDTVPAQTDFSRTQDGYLIQTKLTETTSALNLSTSALPQQTTSAYNAPAFELAFGTAITGSVGGTAIPQINVADLVDHKLQIVISPVSGSPNMVDYELRYNAALGQQVVNIGRLIKSVDTAKYAKMTVTTALVQQVQVEVVDNASEFVSIGVFDDLLDRLTFTISGVNTKAVVETGLLTTPASNTLTVKYYDVLVTVSRAGKEYARILSTWSVED